MREFFPLATHVFLVGNHINTEQRDKELEIAREKRRRHLRNLSEENLERNRGRRRRDNRAIYTREDKPRLTLAAAYIIHERNYLYEYKLQGQDKPQLDKAVNVDFVPFIRGARVLCKPRLIFPRINGPNFNENQRFLFF